MESGTSSFTRCGRFLVLVLAAFVVVIGSAAAQQVGDGTQSSPSAKPAETPAALPPAIPAAQPVSQAAVSASGVAPAKAPDAAQDAADQSMTVKLGPGDLIEVNVYNVPELTSKVRVSLAGDVYLPLIDYVHVEGLTQEEAQKLIEKRLVDGGFVRSPHVTIFVDEGSSSAVTILGEVQKPGMYPDVADHKLYEVVSEAGGFTPSASRKIAIIRRNQEDPIRIDLPRNLADDLSGNVDIMPGDTITIPRAPVIYVVGDVGRPSGLLVDNGTLTVLQAMALAGGANRTAKLGAARIIHKGPAGMIETKVEIKKMLEAKSPDVTLQADDILFIPISGGKVLAGRTFEAAMAMATAVSIYAVHP
ncbi:MAG TPA: polysaccharide biosynthesis/export family protein [Candidatus Sulfotelmatobacter sp.]|nr:polysaccharide biosynthesis/export family protein [Candidatus Sulfotelmatobacter sp.]